MSFITAMALNLRLELHARGILSLGRADCETIIAAVVTNTAELAKAIEAKISRPTPEEAGQPRGMRPTSTSVAVPPAQLD
jgi:hypothetical protein